MKTLTLLLALCALAAAANVPEPEEMRSADPAIKLKPPPNEVCAPQTPCAWSVYDPSAKLVIVNITNNYCECEKGLKCQRDQNDSTVNSYIHRCRPPGTEMELSG